MASTMFSISEQMYEPVDTHSSYHGTSFPTLTSWHIAFEVTLNASNGQVRVDEVELIDDLCPTPGKEDSISKLFLKTEI